MSSSRTPASAVLRPLFADIIHGARTGDWKRSLNAANKILQAAPDDTKAFHCKIVCMVHMSQFQEVVNLCKKNETLAQHVQFEKCYSLYRLNKAQEALDVLNSFVGDASQSAKLKELKAQVLYRLERYEDCYEIFKDLIRNTQVDLAKVVAEDDYEDERETNLSAVVANLHAFKNQKTLEVGAPREDTYELAYNAACSLISQRKFDEALNKLVTAEDLCKKALEEDDIGEDEIDSELAIIRVQRAYAMQMIDKSDKAANLYGQVLRQKPSDPGLAAITSNNVVVINGEQNIFDSKKKMKVATACGLESKLTNRQRQVIALNHCLLLVQANQLPQCREQVAQLKKCFSDLDSVHVVLIEAALHCREKNENEAIELLKKFLEGHPNELLKISFTLVELFLLQGMQSQACETLKSLGDVSYKPGVVSALVSLYLHLEDKDSAAWLFKDAVEWYKLNDPTSEHQMVLWRASANFHMTNGNAEAAAESLEEIRRIYPKDVKILAQLITAYSQFDTKRAVLASKDLPSVDEVLSKNVDIDNLESNSWTTNTKYLRKAAKVDVATPAGLLQSGSGGTDNSDKQLKRRKRKKKGKLPKNYDPSILPDPERWLPRKDRLTYKKRKERNARGATTIGKGTQGSTTGSADMDASVKTSGGLLRTNTAATNISPGERRVRQDKPVQAMKKVQKKKASGKW